MACRLDVQLLAHSAPVKCQGLALRVHSRWIDHKWADNYRFAILPRPQKPCRCTCLHAHAQIHPHIGNLRRLPCPELPKTS